MRTFICGIGAGAAILAMASAVSAAVIAGENFNALTAGSTEAIQASDGTNGSGGPAKTSGVVTGYLSTFISTAPTGHADTQITAQEASAGDNYLQINTDIPSGIAYWGVTWGSNWHGNSNSGGTNYALSDLTLSFDARGVRPVSGAASISVSDRTNTLSGTFTATTDWTHYSMTLDTLTPGGSNTGPFDPTSAFFVFSVGYGQTGFGTAAGSPQLQFDNIAVSAPDATVPEPASLALLGLGAAGLFLKRRMA